VHKKKKKKKKEQMNTKMNTKTRMSSRCCLALPVLFLFALALLPQSHALSALPSAVKLRIGTRGSPLALAQAHETKNILRSAFAELRGEGAIEIKRINTEVGSAKNQIVGAC
jgi:hypothetical protein